MQQEMARSGEPFLTERIEAAAARATRPLAFVGVIGMLVIASITVVDVIARWAASAAVLALNEIVSMLFAVAVAACIPAGVSGGVNLKVDLLARWLNQRTREWLDSAGNALLLIFFALLTWRIAVYALALWGDGRTTVILRWPVAPFMMAIAALLAISSALQLVITINGLRRTICRKADIGEPRTPLLATLFAILAGVTLLVVAIATLFFFAPAATWARSNVGSTVLIGFGVMWLLMFALVPLAAVMGLTGAIGSALFIGWSPSFSALATESTGFLFNAQVATLPLFLMMGSFAAAADMSGDLYRLAHALLSRYRGGLALATIGGCAGFGALTGSSLATAATIGRVAIPEMEARGYSPALSTGCCAAGGTLGAIVPPGSGPLIVFALLTEASIGKLFIGSVGPAIVAVALYFVTVAVYVRWAPTSAPATGRPPPGELRAAFARCRAVGLLFLLVMGGLYFGLFTDTESAAVGAVGAFMITWWRGKLRRDVLLDVMAETTATTALIYGLIFGAMTFSFFVGVSGLAEAFTSMIRALDWPAAAVMTLLLAVFLLLGSLMESLAVMVIAVPVVTPLVLDLGYDLIWWGIIMLCVVETGLIHPPLGLNVFVLKSMLPHVPLWTIYKGVMPFVGADLIKLVILVIFPGITLWLVSTMQN